MTGADPGQVILSCIKQAESITAHTFNPSIHKAETGESLRVQDLQCEFHNSQGYVERFCLKERKKKRKEGREGAEQAIEASKLHFYIASTLVSALTFLSDWV